MRLCVCVWRWKRGKGVFLISTEGIDSVDKATAVIKRITALFIGQQFLHFIITGCTDLLSFVRTSDRANIESKGHS